jgi:hypothetical protein
MANPTLVELFQDIADEIRNKRKDLETTDLLVAANFPEEIRKIVTDPSGNVTATASDILYGKTACISGDGSITEGTMPDKTGWSSALSYATQSVTIPKGYHDGTKTVTASYPSGSISRGTLTLSPTSGSTPSLSNGNYVFTTTATLTDTVVKTGWLSASTSGGDSATATFTMPRASVTVKPSAGNIQPTLSRGSKGTSETWTNADDTSGSVILNGTTPTSGVYIKVSSESSSSKLAGTAGYTNTAGYTEATTTTSGKVNVTTNLQSSVLYVPVKIGAVTTSTATKTLNPNKPTFSYEGNVITATAKNNGNVSISPSVTTEGWVTSSNITAANVPISGSNSDTYTITALTAGVVKTGTTILGVTGTYTSDATATAAQILYGKTAYVKGSPVTGSMTNNGALNPPTLTYSNKSYTIPAGYTSGGTVTASYPSSSISGGTLALQIASSTTSPYTTAPTWNSTSSKWEYSVSASRAAVSNASAGWTTKSTVIDVDSTSNTIQIPKIGISVAGGTDTLTPNFTVGTLGSSETWINAANGTSYTTSATASTPYVKLTVSADTKYISITPSVTTAGYGGTGSGEYTISTNTSGTAKFQSSTIYVPIKTTSPSATKITAQNGAVTISPGYITSTTTITATFPTSTAKVTADSFTITPSITYNSTTGYITATGNNSTTITPSVSGNGYITTSAVSGAAVSASLSGGSVTPASILPSSTVPSSLTITDQNGTLTIGAGWLASSQTIKATITSGSVSATSSLTFAGKTTASTITPTWTVNSGGTAYTSSLSAAISKTTLSAGYFTAKDIVSAKTITHTLSIAAAKISTSGASISITPSIASNISSISGCTNAAASATLVSSVTSGNVYVPVTVSGSNNGNASYLATAGYLPATSATNISSSASIKNTTQYVQINKSNVTSTTITSQNGTYTVPVGYVTSTATITATINNATITGPTSSITTGTTTKSTPTWNSSSETITIPISAKGDQGTVDIIVSKAGYVSSITGGAATASFTGSVSLTKTELQTLEPNLTGDNILSGKSIFGVSGNLVSPVSTKNTFLQENYFTYASSVDSASTEGTITIGSSEIAAGLVAYSGIKGEKVYNAVWNDLADLIPVDDECELEFGKCYCFDGEKYYKSTKYLDDGVIGIHSDVAGFEMGHKKDAKELKCSVAGFVLAYVDKEYPVGTLLTCAEDGYLTEIKKEDKINYPEKIVGSYWKDEKEEYWGSEQRKVLVNGRKWIKVR